MKRSRGESKYVTETGVSKSERSHVTLVMLQLAIAQRWPTEKGFEKKLKNVYNYRVNETIARTISIEGSGSVSSCKINCFAFLP